MNANDSDDSSTKVGAFSNGELNKENGSNLKSFKIAKLIKEMLEIVNPNLDEEIMSKTPFRYAEALLELTEGTSENQVELISGAVFNSQGFDDLIIVKDISFNSMCEHQLLPFFGECTIGYIPKDKILGLSKFPRLVGSLSKKLHIQERLTKEIADIINKVLTPEGVIVKLSSSHSCMCFRGVKSFNSKTDTIYTIGSMKDSKNLDKFFNLLRK
jgi:GTP cyclohydrolase I